MKHIDNKKQVSFIGAPEGQRVHANELCRLLHIGERRLRQLARQGVISQPKDGRYDFEASIQGYVRFLQERLNHFRRRGLGARRDELLHELKEILEEEGKDNG